MCMSAVADGDPTPSMIMMMACRHCPQPFYYTDLLLVKASKFVLNQRNWTNMSQMAHVGNCGHISKAIRH